MTHLPAMGMCFRKRGLEILFAKLFYRAKTHSTVFVLCSGGSSITVWYSESKINANETGKKGVHLMISHTWSIIKNEYSATDHRGPSDHGLLLFGNKLWPFDWDSMIYKWKQPSHHKGTGFLLSTNKPSEIG